MVLKSLEAGDDAILSAVMAAPACLSGLSEPEVQGFASMWRQRKFPAEMKRTSYLEGVSKALHLGGQLLVGYGQKMSAEAVVREAKAFQKTTADAVRAATGAQ